jgi:hypothetical protein
MTKKKWAVFAENAIRNVRLLELMKAHGEVKVPAS